jgi:hypothetical protein
VKEAKPKLTDAELIEAVRDRALRQRFYSRANQVQGIEWKFKKTGILEPGDRQRLQRWLTQHSRSVTSERWVEMGQGKYTTRDD